ncbi:hypothetical protein C2845_PM13G07180 [Panicum miliaceum]|uniref:FAR1 domain-containing protein n=1 Tax=Panicum miliaceum TaxID=4540 RepID=A0A3L6RGW8_PANMI|nr:hypothetical protein C2845_PM13G07180 [Panicum miliaceum]
MCCNIAGGKHNDVGNPKIADSTTQSDAGYSLNNQETAVVPGEVEVDVTEEVVEDVWLTPPVPYTGQTFCSKQEAREFYNLYAKRIYFSFRTSTTYLSSLTREQNKIQFVCNKEGRERKAKEEQPNAETDDSNFEEDSDPKEGNESAEKKEEAGWWKEEKMRKDGQFQYWLVPNNKFVYGYGKRKYLVTAVVEEESYYCESSKFDRDGMLCCHIMKILARLGIKNIPQRYILKRWMQEAIPENVNTEPNVHVPADFIARGMPLNSKRNLWFTNIIYLQLLQIWLLRAMFRKRPTLLWTNT